MRNKVASAYVLVKVLEYLIRVSSLRYSDMIFGGKRN